MRARRVAWLVSAFCILHSAFGNDLSVDRRTIRLTDTLTITVSLEDAFASVEHVSIPLQNLVIDSGPSISSEFSWINGAIVRRKVFRFTARPLHPGAALVGPLVVNGEGGQRETLAPISVQIVPDLAAGTNDPLTILRELVATGRDPFFVVAEADRSSVFVGEEVVVTWVLYNGASVQDWRMTRIPKLADFWSEELDVRSEQPAQTIVGTTVMQRLPIRRMALFPLRGGKLTVDSLEVSGQVMRRIDSGPFGMFEGAVVDVRFPSAQLAVDVKPLPPGPEVSAIGEISMRCVPPLQRGGGPVAFDVTMSGRGNLRAATPPRWMGRVDGDVQIEEGEVAVDRRREAVLVTRRWKYMIFPLRAGRLDLPPLVATIFSPSAGERQQLRCKAVSLLVEPASATTSGTKGSVRRKAPFSPRLAAPWFGGLAIAVIVLAIAAARTGRSLRIRREMQQVALQPSLAAIRESADSMLMSRGVDPHELVAEPSERGDAYRSLRSLLEALDRQRTTPEDARDEIAARVRDLVQSLG